MVVGSGASHSLPKVSSYSYLGIDCCDWSVMQCYIQCLVDWDWRYLLWPVSCACAAVGIR